MPKRRRSDEDVAGEYARAKRGRTGSRRNLLDISDEILLRILSYLPIRELLRTERVSRRMRALATDGGIWKLKYLDTFTRPRLRAPAVVAISGESIDWKSRFKTKTNWSNGKAKLHELEVARPPARPVIAKVHNGVIFTVDPSGLRAWSSKQGTRTLRAHFPLDTKSGATCLSTETVGGRVKVLLGFDDGSWSVYVYERDQFEVHSTHLSADGPLLAVSLSHPYAMTVSRTKFLSIYRLGTAASPSSCCQDISTVARFQSDASFSPISVSLRRAPSGIIAAVAYAFQRLHSGWCMGLQEIRLNANGCFLGSRLASTLETALDTEIARQNKFNLTTRFTSSMPLALHPQMRGPPTSLSYEHPYLIGTLADNTMMSFLVTSNQDSLDIGPGRRLWGHTSAVSGAEVNNRGKAVSISSRGDEVRVWELENVMTGFPAKTSTRIRPVEALSSIAAALARRGSGLGLALPEVKRELELNRRWVGFDEHQVVVLGETADHTQIMALYDFT
ncbi:F-box domain containing protein [Cladophialophora carrionii]|uniref:Probable E3 ubiquitin ligase complex SCF subunit sconB n=1 Tax=Cladophialophora carrionii TaxID=86049 RepID=A0A1C1CAF8_9EURO|nr:F-box domain containing protein [Cladophialophora carrionii]